MNEHEHIKSLLENKSLRDFIFSNLRQSLSSIGFSQNLIEDLVSNLENLNVQEFGKNHSEELKQVYNVGFFQRIVPAYFSQYVVPVTPTVEKIVDVGCGTGILAKLYSESKKFQHILGIDINPYPEWGIFKNTGVDFRVIKETDFIDFLHKEKPDSIVLTWTLHHMEYEEQERYMGYIYDALKINSYVVVLEDSYSSISKPENGSELYTQFMNWEESDRKKIMSVYDWVANRVLAQREKVPIPFAYQTMEKWEELFKKTGFSIENKKFIGFPNDRDINTPQSLIILKK